MSWHYSFVNKIVRKLELILFHKANDDFYLGKTKILTLNELYPIKNPSLLQKYRFIVVKGPILVETDSINDIIYTDYNGRRAFSKDVEVLSYF